MEGKEFVASFDVGIPPAPDYDAIDDRRTLLRASEMNLVGKIALLYGAGEIHTIGSDPPGEAISRAHVVMSNKAAHRVMQNEAEKAAAEALKNGTEPLPPLRYMTAAMLASIDTTGSMSPAELERTVEHGREGLQASVRAYSDMIMDRSLRFLHRVGSRREIKPKDSAEAVKESLAHNRLVFNDIMAPAAGIITVERDFKLSSSNVAMEEVDLRVSIESQGRYVPEWMKAAKEFDSPLQLVCSLYTELEALIALQEWVIDRKLPYLPIFTPYEFERGPLTKDQEMNLHSDILLCCLQPDRNEVIPVQVKNRILESTRKEYHDGVVLVSNQDLGTRTAAASVILDGKKRRTGRRVTDTYGAILGHYLKARGTGSGKFRHKPPKGDRQAFTEILKPAFGHFDHEIGRRIKEYGTVPA